MNPRECPTSKKKRWLIDCIRVSIISLSVFGVFTAPVANAFAYSACSRVLQNHRAHKGGNTRPLLFNDKQRNENSETELESAATSDGRDGATNTIQSKNQKKKEGNGDSNNSSGSKSLDELLDQSFFDPDKVAEDDPAPLRWFADLVKNDYATAETLFAGFIFVVLVVVSQELLRVQMFGLDGYVPFQAGVKPGQLF